MRRAFVALALLTACSSDPPAEESTTKAQWKAGSAVAVLTADVVGEPDVSDLGQRPGVISAGGTANGVRIAFGRRALLTDAAALQRELAARPGWSNVTLRVVAPR